jgi:hypothetical protein
MSARPPLPLPEAVSRALRPLRLALEDLKYEKRLVRERAIIRLENAIADLKLGMRAKPTRRRVICLPISFGRLALRSQFARSRAPAPSCN